MEQQHRILKHAAARATLVPARRAQNAAGASKNDAPLFLDLNGSKSRLHPSNVPNQPRGLRQERITRRDTVMKPEEIIKTFAQHF